MNHHLSGSARFAGLLFLLALTTACNSTAPISPTSTSIPSLAPLSAPSLVPTVRVAPLPTLQPTATATVNALPTTVSPTTVPATSPVAPTKPAPTSAASTAVPGSACTDAAVFVADVNLPDNTVVAPGQTFAKTWRLRNTGTCTWSTGYHFTFTSGQAMTTTTSIAVPQTAPRATVDLTISMNAPTTPGTYQGFWQLRDSKGTRFGSPVWVLIKVAGTPVAAPPVAASSLGVFVTQLQLDPPQPSFNQPVGFRITLRNTTPSSQTLRWFIKLYQCPDIPCSEDQLRNSMVNLERSFGESTAVVSTIDPGTALVAAPATWTAGSGACVYTAVPHFFDPTGQGVLPILKPDGIPLYYTFDFCQTPK